MDDSVAKDISEALRDGETREAYENMEDFGAMIAKFFKSMVAHGMKRHEALEVSCVWLRGFMEGQGAEGFPTPGE